MAENSKNVVKLENNHCIKQWSDEVLIKHYSDASQVSQNTIDKGYSQLTREEKESIYEHLICNYIAKNPGNKRNMERFLNTDIIIKSVKIDERGNELKPEPIKRRRSKDNTAQIAVDAHSIWD